jgi:hypothetical protein
VRTLENVEDMDPATLTAGICWEFETFPEYLELVRRRGTVLSFTACIGHSALRLYVMGDAAYERAATSAEIESMCRLVREALDAGAAGFSSSFSFAHRGVDGKPVPSRFAARDEVEALFSTVGRVGKGVVLATPGEQCSYPDFYALQQRIGRPLTWPLFATPNDGHFPQLKLHEESLTRDARVWPQVTPRPLTMQFTLEDAYNLNVSQVFGELLKVSRWVRWPPARSRAGGAGSLRRRSARRSAVRRAALHRSAGPLGAGAPPPSPREGGPQDERRGGRPLRLRRPRLSARGLLRRCVRFRPGDGGPRPPFGACATSRRRPSA